MICHKCGSFSSQYDAETETLFCFICYESYKISIDNLYDSDIMEGTERRLKDEEKSVDLD